MAGATPMLKIGKGFGTWLIPIIIFGILGTIALLSLIVLVWTRFCRSRRKIRDQEPETTHEIYRTPTIPYKEPADLTIGRLVTHSRSLHVPRNQMVNAHRLRPQVSSPELRNTSRPPPYTYRTPVPSRLPRPQGRVYFDPGNTRFIPHQSQQSPPSPEILPARPERCFSASSPSSYSSSCASVEGDLSTRAFSPPSSPSIFSQESLAPARTLSWVVFPEPHQDSCLDSGNPRSLLDPSDHNEPALVSILDHYQAGKLASAGPRRRSETGRTGLSRQKNRRLIIVDDNLVSGDSEVPSDGFEAHTLRQAEVTRFVRGHVGNKSDRDAVFKVTCPDTGDLWKMPVISGETLERFSSRVMQRAGGDVTLFLNDEILATEEDWKAVKGGGRITAHFIR